ncbi:N-acetylmuramidase family protein [Luteibacter sp. 22Crub2.1]|uniref:N-acetylmuramidase family protein n=1 Tax=Luteibacter sp. 22Crub2.1 TaxID=1283288 RepID=UPI0009D3AD0D|nr:N-acetylmuramidase family protein [Luteibacter sp. 22Crub2.1]SKB55908.1 Protein of unknown function [Luteibacter sp. 22Crub2.1]
MSPLAHTPRTPAEGSKTPSAQPAAERWSYPFALLDKNAPNDMRRHFDALSAMPVGFFPLATSGMPNGSIFFGKECTDLAIDDGFHCLADGEVVAYQLDSKRHILHYEDDTKLRYSLGFVLVRHRLVLPPVPPPASAETSTAASAPQPKAPDESADGIHIYSLYSYNRPLVGYRSDKDGFLIDALPFWQGPRKYRVGARAKDRQIVPIDPLAEALAQRAMALSFGAVVPVPDPGLAPEPGPDLATGLRVRAQGKSGATIIGLLPRGCILTAQGNATHGWAQIASIERGEPLAYAAGLPVSPEVATGWVYLDELDHSPSPSPMDSVVVLDEPYRVKAGERLGFLGENPGKDLAQPPSGVQPDRPRVAIEVFAGDDFPAYLTEARRRAAALPDSEKPILVIERGARLCKLARMPDCSLMPGARILPEPGKPCSGRFVSGRAYRTETRSAKSPLQPGEQAGDYVDPAKGERIDATAYHQLKASRRIRFQQRDIFVPLGETVYWTLRKPTPNACIAIWTSPPFEVDAAEAVVGFASSMSRAELDALGEDQHFADSDGTIWWRVAVGGENNEPLVGWVCNRNHAGTRWESPHAWPGFQLANGSMFEPMEALQRIVCINGMVHPSHEESFQPVATALGASDLVVKLEQAIDHSGTLDGKVTADDIAHARKTHWLARPLSRLIVRLHSQWSHDMERWEKLTSIATSDWQAEMKRQRKRGWWKKVATHLDGFPLDPNVYFIHPFGWVDNFFIKTRQHPTITVAGRHIEIPFLWIPDSSRLTYANYESAAESLQCEPEALVAIAKTESKKVGAYFVPGDVHPDGDDPVPSILFERHIFHSCSNGAYDTQSDISSPHPYSNDDIPYGPFSSQYAKLLKAYELHPDAALKAASWGKFQILGKNFGACGFATVTEFVCAQSENELSQLKSLVAFILNDQRLQKSLRRKDWKEFALAYNGRNQAKSHYDERMASNYQEEKARRTGDGSL